MNIKGKTFAEVYEKSLFAVVNSPEYITSPRGLEIKEILNVMIKIENPQSCLFNNSERDLPREYLAHELILYLLGTNDSELFAKASPFWNKIKTEINTINSAYGNLIFNQHYNDRNNNMTQFNWAKQSLIKDKDSRQAVMHFNRPYHQYSSNKDFVCTMYGNFHIRDNKLLFKISMRSNDMMFGLTFDVPFFCVLHMMMFDALKSTYPDLEMGSYTHNADSLHLYQKDYKLADNMLNHKFESGDIPAPTELCIKHDALTDIPVGVYSGHLIEKSEHEFLKWLYVNLNN